jgi:hypothetical protein
MVTEPYTNKVIKGIRMVIVNFPCEMIEIAASYNENVNVNSSGLAHILVKGEKWKKLHKVTNKEMQKHSKNCSEKTIYSRFQHKAGNDRLQ